MTRETYLSMVKTAADAANAYYLNNEPVMSDYEYDELIRSIRQYETANPTDISPDSPTQKVAELPQSSFEKVTHAVPMLSLQDVFDTDEVAKFVRENAGHTYIVEEKIDGLSMSASYEKGKLVRAETRGDGFIGEDVTENAKFILGLPKSLNTAVFAAPDVLEVRLEVFLPIERFLAINEEREERGEKLFANPRNAAAGLLRTKDISAMKDAGLECFIFNVQRYEGVAPYGDSHIDSLAAMREYGFKTVSAYRPERNEEGVCDVIKRIGEIKNNLPYWIDGAVVKIDSLTAREEIGSTGKYPKWAVAYKYPPEEKETVIRDIILQTGRTGRVTPVAIFDPVFLAGTKVERATLHNQRFIDDIGVNIGDTIVVRKAAEIVPEVVKVSHVASYETFCIDVHKCAACGGSIYVSEDGMTCQCETPSCPAQFARYIEFFASRDCMDIRGMGPAAVNTLIEHGLIKDVVDIYALHTIPEVVGDLLGKKTAENLFAAIEDSKHRSLDRLIKALGMPGIGRHIGKALAEDYGSIHGIVAVCTLGKIDGGGVAELTTLDGIGEIAAHTIMDYFNKPETLVRIKALADCGVNMVAEKKATEADQCFSGKIFVITGTLPTMSRNEAAAFIETRGGKVSGSVSKKTDFLVCGEAAGSKLDKAKSLGVTIITEEELKALS